MKNRGYTLLELLGVIVILALLTALVFPSVLNAIKKSSNQTDKLSMDLISNAADLYIENNVNEFIKFNGNKYIIEPEELIDEGNLPSNIKISDIDNIDDKCIQVTYQDGFKYELKNKGTCEKLVQFDSICKLASDSTVTGVKAGAKYNCKVDPNRNAYTFYVLTTPDDNTVDLIMDRNICDDGSVTTEKNTCLVAWNNESGQSTNTYGPVTAMNYLYNATKDWINIPALNYIYNDREYQNISADNITDGYTSFESNDGILTITQLTGTQTIIGTKEEPLRARMPIYSGIWNDDWTVKTTEKGELSTKTENNAYLYENLNSEVAPYAYWTLSTFSSSAWYVVFFGHISYQTVDSNSDAGVRPVITLPITNSEMIPDEYQVVEYIEGTGTQYLIIDYIASGVTSSKGTFKITDVSKAAFLFGSRDEFASRFYGLNWGGGTPYKYYNSYSNAQLSKLEIDTKTHTFYKDKGTLYIDDKKISDYVQVSFTTPSKMNVFGCNCGSNLGYLPPLARIFDLKFYDENVLAVNLIPCYRKSDGVIGMYDIVEDKFYTNSGTGTFVKGKDI